MAAPPPSLNVQVYEHLKRTVSAWTEPPETAHLNGLLRVMSRWRQFLILEVYRRRQGQTIWSGPFEGMEYASAATEGALLPRLLGCYEHELHPHLAAFAAERPEVVIDVGCAEGYYAVGLARLMPGALIHAHDIDEKAQAACRALAEKNGVADRIRVGGEFRPEDFEAHAGRRVLVMVDCEGAELDILRPELSPALATMSLIVETHDVLRPGALETIRGRFAPTHEIIQVDQGFPRLEPPPWLLGAPHLDLLLAAWEWRVAPTPWLVMRPKAR